MSPTGFLEECKTSNSRWTSEPVEKFGSTLYLNPKSIELVSSSTRVRTRPLVVGVLDVRTSGQGFVLQKAMTQVSGGFGILVEKAERRAY